MSTENPSEQTEASTEEPVEVEQTTTDESSNDAETTDESIDFEQLVQDANQRADENWEKLLLAKAEVENIRRRSQKDLESAHRFAVEGFAKELLSVVDSFEMGIAAADAQSGDINAIKEGMDLTYKQLLSCFEKSKIAQLDPLNTPFNPEFHQAISMVPNEEHPHNTVIQVVQKGYTLNERLLRPAMVVVSQGNPSEKKIDENA